MINSSFWTISIRKKHVGTNMHVEPTLSKDIREGFTMVGFGETHWGDQKGIIKFQLKLSTNIVDRNKLDPL